MKIFKTRKVKSPVHGQSGIKFYLPYDLPGTDYLAPKQSAIVPLGFAFSMDKNLTLLPVSYVRGSQTPQPLQVAITVQNDEAYAYVTNLGDDLVELKPGKFIFRAVVVPIIDEKVQEVETLDEFLNGPKRATTEELREGYGGKPIDGTVCMFCGDTAPNGDSVCPDCKKLETGH